MKTIAVVAWSPPDAECLVFTFKEGVLSAMAHDLCLRVGRFVVTIDEETQAIAARFDAGSIAVVGAVERGVVSPGALSSMHFPRIEGSARNEVLEVGRYPEIAFRSTRVDVKDGAAHVEGRLVLHGVERPLGFTAQKKGDRWKAEIEIDQTQFGIRPFRAMMGALRIKSAVRIAISLPEGRRDAE